MYGAADDVGGRVRHRLTAAQRKLLATAARADGRITSERLVRATMDILLEHGYIEARRMQGTAASERLLTERDKLIAKAREHLASDRWQAAMRFLVKAERKQKEMDMEGLYLTDKGRAAAGGGE